MIVYFSLKFVFVFPFFGFNSALFQAPYECVVVNFIISINFRTHLVGMSLLNMQTNIIFIVELPF